jgi:hypothetical protein
MTPSQDRRQRQREEKLEEIRRQVADGSLTIRQMTAEEAKRFEGKHPRGASRSPRSRPSR